MSFCFELKAEGAVLVSYDGADEIVIIPEQYEGFPVIEIGDHAFYGHREIKRLHLPETLIEAANYAFAECRFLEQATLPEGIQRIGDYAFYNCIRCKSINLPGSLSHMGYGSFKNCSELVDIHLYTTPGNENPANTILNDTNHEMTVSFHYPDGSRSKLVFTEFYFDEVPNIEARQFNHLTYGSGSMYRNCLSAAGLNYRKYDELFSFAVHMDEPETVYQLAANRLMYPYGLTGEAEKMYGDYLIHEGSKALIYFIKSGQLEALNLLAHRTHFDKQALNEALTFAQENGNSECVCLFIHYKNLWYPSAEKSYDL